MAHQTIRNRGTTVGSLVHADPAAEMPAVLLLCDGSVELASAAGTRTVPAAEFFVGPLESALRAGRAGRRGHASRCRRRAPAAPGSRCPGGPATTRSCGVGADASRSTPTARIAAARAAYISVGPTPVLVDLTDAVAGSAVDAADWAAAGALAQAQVEPEEDIHATADYRRHLVGVLTAAGRPRCRRPRPGPAEAA